MNAQGSHLGKRRAEAAGGSGPGCEHRRTHIAGEERPRTWQSCELNTDHTEDPDRKNEARAPHSSTRRRHREHGHTRVKGGVSCASPHHRDGTWQQKQRHLMACEASACSFMHLGCEGKVTEDKKSSLLEFFIKMN